MDSSRGVKLVAALMEVARFGRLRIAESSGRSIADPILFISDGHCCLAVSLSASDFIHCQDKIISTIEAQFHMPTVSEQRTLQKLV